MYGASFIQTHNKYIQELNLMPTTAPTPVDVPITVITIGRPTSGPQSVPPGPGTTGQIPTAPTPIGPPETAPPPVTPGVDPGQSSGTTATVTIPVNEAPVTETVTNTTDTVPVATPVYISVLSDGTVVTENTLQLNFLGTGVTVEGTGSNANITITAGGGNGNYGNSNVVTLLAGFGSNTVVTTGNITAGYVLGNGSQLTGLPATYGNSNVATLLAGFGSNTVSTTGNITGGNILGGANVNATTHTGTTASLSGNVTGGNIVTAGQVSATGNITGSFFVGNGSLLTGIAASSYGNANVAANLAAFGSNPVSTTGNVTAGNFIGNVVGGGAGTPTISSATNLDLSAAAAVRVIGGGTFRLPSLTTAQIANTIAANGDMIYNSSVNKFQGYENGAWANII